MNTAAEQITKGHHLTFCISGEQYSISIQRVREIIEFDSVRPVPGTPAYVTGVINLRGAVVPVVDLSLKFGLDDTPITKDTCIIILDVTIDGKPGAMGVMTEAVSEVLELADSDIEEPPAFGTQVHVDYLIGMSMIDGRMALVLDIDEVLQSSEIVKAIQREALEEDSEDVVDLDVGSNDHPVSVDEAENLGSMIDVEAEIAAPTDVEEEAEAEDEGEGEGE